jgi:hypothetical protein
MVVNLTRAELTPFQTHCYTEKVVAPGIQPGTSGLAARNCNQLNGNIKAVKSPTM